ncbi:MAG: Spi family protease inhibitor [Muribaculaceae bacterium]|nr:Spi family protease inhibitor [Muribaculaceae bacterium]
MLNPRNILTIFLLLISFSASIVKGETVSQKEAMGIAQTFFNTLYGEVTAPPKLIWNGRQLTTDRLFNPFYIYNSPKGGFVIISAENKAYPVLAYSKENQFSRDKLGEEENELLKQYAREIELIRYDSRIPTSALASWQDKNRYLDRMVKNPYNTSEYLNLSEEKKERIERIDRRNGWIAMPTAIEFAIYDPDDYRDYELGDALVEAEEIPFSFYEEFIKSIEEENALKAKALDEILSPTKPVLNPMGGGHFQILFPEDIRMVRVYGMDGTLGIEKYYKGTNLINVDLASLVPGFYAVIVLSDSGKVYGMKLYR